MRERAKGEKGEKREKRAKREERGDRPPRRYPDTLPAYTQHTPNTHPTHAPRHAPRIIASYVSYASTKASRRTK